MKRVLFVDDETSVLDGLRRMLHGERDRWEMYFVTSGEAGLRVCEGTRIDVVVSDMGMPGMDGATFLTHLRKRVPAAARVVLSGYLDAASAARSVSVAHRHLSKPCSRSELVQVIEQMCSLQELLTVQALREIVGSIGELPSLSETYMQLMKAMREQSTSAHDVAAIVEQDIAMSAKILQLANSAFFGLSRPVTSLESAATYLGVDTIKTLALASDAFRILQPSRRVPPSTYASIQSHSSQAAAVVLGLPLSAQAKADAVITALLHDIGGLLLAARMPDEFCAATEYAESAAISVYEAEQVILGTSHAEIGAYLLGIWGIPSNIVDAIANHHDPTRNQQAGRELATAVYLANLLAHDLELRPTPDCQRTISEKDRIVLQELAVTEDEFERLRNQVKQKGS